MANNSGIIDLLPDAGNRARDILAEHYLQELETRLGGQARVDVVTVAALLQSQTTCDELRLAYSEAVVKRKAIIVTDTHINRLCDEIQDLVECTTSQAHELYNLRSVVPAADKVLKKSNVTIKGRWANSFLKANAERLGITNVDDTNNKHKSNLAVENISTKLTSKESKQLKSNVIGSNT